MTDYRPIAGFPGYEIDQAGAIRSFWTTEGNGFGQGSTAIIGHVARPIATYYRGKSGPYVKLVKGGKQRSRTVRKLVAATFSQREIMLTVSDQHRANAIRTVPNYPGMADAAETIRVAQNRRPTLPHQQRIVMGGDDSAELVWAICRLCKRMEAA